ncbi:MAG: HepT-like ribonuclease domain-containing protein [Candidatus Omnitrophota bacterium]
MGDAARHILENLKQRSPEIPWKVIIAQRHVLAHDYDEIKYEQLWNVCQKNLPILVEQLELLLSRLPEDI